LAAGGELHTLLKQTDRARIAFAETNIDLAFTCLRLADAEIRGGKAGRASELIEKAILAYKTLLQDAEILSAELDEEKCELHERTQRLLEAVFASERQFQILAG
jgi:hypothetical protein